KKLNKLFAPPIPINRRGIFSRPFTEHENEILNHGEGSRLTRYLKVYAARVGRLIKTLAQLAKGSFLEGGRWAQMYNDITWGMVILLFSLIAPFYANIAMVVAIFADTAIEMGRGGMKLKANEDRIQAIRNERSALLEEKRKLEKKLALGTCTPEQQKDIQK